MNDKIIDVLNSVTNEIVKYPSSTDYTSRDTQYVKNDTGYNEISSGLVW